MKTKIAIFLTLALTAGLLSGCAGTTVVYRDGCACADGGETLAVSAVEAGAVKTGLYIGTDLSGSKSAGGEDPGEAKFDVTLVAVTVDEAGVIDACVIDSIPASVAFGGDGVITTDLDTEVLSKNELGEAYGMKAYGGSKYEWNEQAAALARYAQGKTVDQLKNGAVDASGKAADADLASVATISLGGYVSAIEAAVANAQHLGAQKGEELRLAAISGLDGSASADGETEGIAQLSVDVTALTMDGQTITSCVIDSVQAKVAFDAAGTIATDLSLPVLTKNELGEAYGMKRYAGSRYEWNEQAAAFAAYVTGKTADDVAGIAVNEANAPGEADLASTVTISIGGFQALIRKAAQ